MSEKITRAAAGGIAVVLLSLASCQITGGDYFLEYRNANLLSDASKGLTEFALGYETQGVALGSFQYADWSAVTGPTEIGSTEGLPAGAEVYRFEIFNLLVNGDFEDPDIGAWTTTGDGTRSVVDGGTPGAQPITGQSLDFWLSTDQFLALQLDATTMNDGLLEGAEYAINLDYNADPVIARMYFGFLPSSGADVPKDWVATIFELGGEDYDTWQFPETTGRNGRVSIPASSSTAEFRIGRDSFQQSGTLDNVRISRSDIRPYIEVTVSTGELRADRPLIGGSYYEFSVYVKPEVDALVTPTTPNRYRANGISTWVNDEMFSVPSESWPTDRWTKITHTFELPAMAIPQDESAVALRLRLAPTLYSDQDAGSLLIAAPELMFNPPSGAD